MLSTACESRAVIRDANILIDMAEGSVLEKIFVLDRKFAVPDVLFHEELRGQHPGSDRQSQPVARDQGRSGSLK